MKNFSKVFEAMRSIAIIVMLAVISVGAFAQMSGTTPDGFEWSGDNRGVTIDLYRGTATDVRIPSDINGLLVVRIGQQAFDAVGTGIVKIRSVVIPNSVTHIEASAFNGQSELTTITFSSRLVEIGARAFSNCYALTSITLPASLTTIGNDAFRYNRSLTTVTIPSSITRITFGTTARVNTTVFQGTRLDEASQTAVKRVGYSGEF